MAKCLRSIVEQLARYPYLYGFLICLIIDLLFCKGWLNFWQCKSSFFISACLLLIIYIFFRRYKEYRAQLDSLFIMGCSFFLKLDYILRTSVLFRQHDVSKVCDVGEYFDKIAPELTTGGHLSYINYLFLYHHLPYFDPRKIWQFAHPPLHHILGAMWLRFNNSLFSVTSEQNYESLQILTLFYAMCIVISAYKVLKYFDLKGCELQFPLAIISFHPAFTALASSVNNDTLSVAFSMASISYILQWYAKRELSLLVKSACLFGLGLLTKMSVVTLLLPFLLLFVAALYKDKKIFKQVAIFWIICIPLGLSFGIHNYINWQMPVVYVYKPSLEIHHEQYLGDDFAKRCMTFPELSLQNIYPRSIDVNPSVIALKSSIFPLDIDEHNFNHNYTLNLIALVLFISNLSIFILALLSMFYKKFYDEKCIEKLFFVILYLILIGGLYKLSYDHPYVFSSNFRYITPVVIINSLFIGFASHYLDRSRVRTAVKNFYFMFMASLTFLFCFSSVLIWLEV